jgi:hypothetical protein
MTQIKQTTKRKGVSKESRKSHPLSAPGPNYNSQRQVTHIVLPSKIANNSSIPAGHPINTFLKQG